MEKKEFLKLSKEIDTIEKLKEKEKTLIYSITKFAEKELSRIDDEDKVKDLVNKCVNAFASTYQIEVGLMCKESAKILERVRVVSASTVSREKKKSAPADSGKNENEKS